MSILKKKGKGRTSQSMEETAMADDTMSPTTAAAVSFTSAQTISRAQLFASSSFSRESRSHGVENLAPVHGNPALSSSSLSISAAAPTTATTGTSAGNSSLFEMAEQLVLQRPHNRSVEFGPLVSTPVQRKLQIAPRESSTATVKYSAAKGQKDKEKPAKKKPQGKKRKEREGETVQEKAQAEIPPGAAKPARKQRTTKQSTSTATTSAPASIATSSSCDSTTAAPISTSTSTSTSISTSTSTSSSAAGRRRRTASKGGSKKDKSLAFYTKAFVEKIQAAPCKTLTMDKAAELLHVRKRRVYDITNIFEGAGLLKKACKNTVQWTCGGTPSEAVAEEIERENVTLTELLDDEADLDAEILKLEEEKRQKPGFVALQDLRRVLPVDHQIIAVRAPQGAVLNVLHPENKGNGQHYLVTLHSDGKEAIEAFTISQTASGNHVFHKFGDPRHAEFITPATYAGAEMYNTEGISDFFPTGTFSQESIFGFEHM